MASTPEPINAALTVAALTLYTAFVEGAATRGMLVSLDLTNTTTADITVDLYVESAGPVDRRFADDIIVPAKTSVTWRGLITLNTAGQLIRATASATGVDCLGTVLENA